MGVVDYVLGLFEGEIKEDFKRTYHKDNVTPDQLKEHVESTLNRMYLFVRSDMRNPGVVCGDPDETPRGILGKLGYHRIGWQILTPKGKEIMDKYCKENKLPEISSTNIEAQMRFQKNMILELE